MNAQQTPGSWSFQYANDVGPDDDYFIEFFEVSSKDGKVLARVDEESDARLMAAAPDLLDALVTLPQGMSSTDQDWWDWVDKARSAINKATGEQT